MNDEAENFKNLIVNLNSFLSQEKESKCIKIYENKTDIICILRQMSAFHLYRYLQTKMKTFGLY